MGESVLVLDQDLIELNQNLSRRNQDPSRWLHPIVRIQLDRVPAAAGRHRRRFAVDSMVVL